MDNQNRNRQNMMNTNPAMQPQTLQKRQSQMFTQNNVPVQNLDTVNNYNNRNSRMFNGNENFEQYQNWEMNEKADEKMDEGSGSDLTDKAKEPVNNKVNIFGAKTDGVKATHQDGDEIEITTTRKIWLGVVYSLTFLTPNFLLRGFGKGRDDICLAWREKVALCMIIVFIWCVLLFVIVGLGLLLCPKQQVWTSEELLNHVDEKDAYISMRGNVYEITHFMNQIHGLGMNGASKTAMMTYAGFEVNSSFPLEVRSACPQLVSQQDDPDGTMYLSTEVVDENSLGWYSHKVGSLASSTELNDPGFYWKFVLPRMKSLRKGPLVWEMKKVESFHKDLGLYWRVINGEVFNLGDYFYTSRLPQNLSNKKWSFLSPEIEAIFDDGGARTTDATEFWKNLRMNSTQKAYNYNCMKQLFYVGNVDTRRSVKCLFTNYMLLAFAMALVVVVMIKFIAALQFGSKKKPLPSGKFVICQVPCYTEGEISISRTLNSLAALDYNDERKLIFVICDGNIVGGGNDRSTPRIVLETLGVDPSYDPPEREYLAIAEGSKQYNRAKIYSGLYEFEGHVVPFLVVVKVGNPHENSKPGNRGKRDSQILLMAFLNKVHFDLPMSPLELEIYHHMQHIIGIPAKLFDYLLQVDADTVVAPDSLSRLVSACSSDGRIAGICGETRLANEQKSWITMMQVYEYFISHHMAKAFESIFGAVTCLPGCFCMYRILSPDGKPLLIANPILEAYSERHVDTLHKKNLLSLGEDRYLTTLMLKHFPDFSLKFIRDARCDTIAPEKWSVLLSQRRRWINSTVHNLFELVLIEDLCGFCCFSMRFVVMLDLFGTLTIPTVLIYMCYLVFISITKFADVGIISLIIIGAVYGLQAIIFILRREWQHIGWMIIYLACFPLWSFVLPVYSFWHFDDFSWGNTRTVVGEGKKKIIVENDFDFNPASIPHLHWAEYEAQLISLGQLNEPAPNMNSNTVLNENLLPPPSRAGTRVGSPMSYVGVPTAPTPIGFNYNDFDMQGGSRGLGNSSQMFNNNMVAPINVDNVASMPVAYDQHGNPIAMHDAQNMSQGYYSNGMEMNDQHNQDQFMMMPQEMLTEEQIFESIQRIMSSSDLNHISKKNIRDMLSAEYGMDMTPYKDYISEVVDTLLSGN
ncbi:Chitin synthase 6 [Smittium culicis]|uniref:chitin synthase n=1 Tax=Smittium culicis TaxID=133412 RepID=A0A1R1X6Y0_9FUNG|nr:Chitin synthase 6 [Smittium culicis]OMJ17975.1 Chitin synthase 6 [Smittium culicis]